MQYETGALACCEGMDDNQANQQAVEEELQALQKQIQIIGQAVNGGAGGTIININPGGSVNTSNFVNAAQVAAIVQGSFAANLVLAQPHIDVVNDLVNVDNQISDLQEQVAGIKDDDLPLLLPILLAQQTYLAIANIPTALAAYATTQSVENLLAAYDLTVKFGYNTLTDLIDEVKATYVKATDLTTILGDYVKTVNLPASITDYVTNQTLADTMALYWDRPSTEELIEQSAIQYWEATIQMFDDYVKKTDLATTLLDYVKTIDLPPAIVDYVPNLTFNNTVQAIQDAMHVIRTTYVTIADIPSYLTPYILKTEFPSYFVQYVKKIEIPSYLVPYVLKIEMPSYTAPYVLIASMNQYLAPYATQAWVTTQINAATATLPSAISFQQTLTDYITSSSLATTLSGYVQTSALSAYVTATSLASTLSTYITHPQLITILGQYSDSALTQGMQILESYVTSASLTTTLANYVQTSALSAYATTASLSSYVTSSSLATTLSGYLTPASLTPILDQYAVNVLAAGNNLLTQFVTIASLPTVLADYVKTSTLASYVTSNSLATTLSGYVQTATLSLYLSATTPLQTVAAPTGSLSLNSQKIINLATPTLATDAVTKAYADSLVVPSTSLYTKEFTGLTNNSILTCTHNLAATLDGLSVQVYVQFLSATNGWTTTDWLQVTQLDRYFTAFGVYGYMLAGNSANYANSFLIVLANNGFGTLAKGNQDFNAYNWSAAKMKVLVTPNNGKYLSGTSTYATSNLVVNSDLNFNNYTLTGLNLATQPTDAVSVQYLTNQNYTTASQVESGYYSQQTSINNMLKPTAPLDLNSKPIINLTAATTNSGATTLAQVNSLIASSSPTTIASSNSSALVSCTAGGQITGAGSLFLYATNTVLNTKFSHVMCSGIASTTAPTVAGNVEGNVLINENATINTGNPRFSLVVFAKTGNDLYNGIYSTGTVVHATSSGTRISQDIVQCYGAVAATAFNVTTGSWSWIKKNIQPIDFSGFDQIAPMVTFEYDKDACERENIPYIDGANQTGWLAETVPSRYINENRCLMKSTLESHMIGYLMEVVKQQQSAISQIQEQLFLLLNPSQ